MTIFKNKLVYNLINRGLCESLQSKDTTGKIAMGVYDVSKLPESITSAIKKTNSADDSSTLSDADSIILCKLLIDPNSDEPKKITEDKLHDIISRCLYLDKSDVTVLSLDIEGAKYLSAKIKFTDDDKTTEKPAETTDENPEV